MTGRAVTGRADRGLSADNSTTWFHAHRDVYERAVRGELEAMLDELAMEYGGHARLFRQNRDALLA